MNTEDILLSILQQQAERNGDIFTRSVRITKERPESINVQKKCVEVGQDLCKKKDLLAVVDRILTLCQEFDDKKERVRLRIIADHKAQAKKHISTLQRICTDEELATIMGEILND